MEYKKSDTCRSCRSLLFICWYQMFAENVFCVIATMRPILQVNILRGHSVLFLLIIPRVLWDTTGSTLPFNRVTVFPLAFIAGWLQGHWWGFISRNYEVWPTFLLMNVFIALKGSHFWFLFDFTAAGVVPCGGRKTSPRTPTIVQFIFYFGPLRSAVIFWEIRNKWLV